MDILNSFSLCEKIDVLKAQGYVVKKVSVDMTYTPYHNDVFTVTANVWGVFDKDENEFEKPMGYSFHESEWVDGAFKRVVERIVKTKLLDFLLEPPKP